MSKKDKLLNGSVISAKTISLDDINEMYQLFIQYYDNADFDTFKTDLNKKDAVFMIRRKDNNDIAGFSTIVKKKIDGLKKGRNSYAVFSGDTIVGKEFWGTTVLHFTAVRYIIMEKLKNPASSIYWFLICKGYKTYLIMANNFNNYYPRFDNEDDPKMKGVLRTLCMKFFPEYYDEKSGLLIFGDSSMKLKENVAEITEEMKKKNSKIKYFEKMNPTWQNGTELPCTVELTFASILSGAARQVVKLVKSSIFRKKKTGKVVHRTTPLKGIQTSSSPGFNSIQVGGSSGVSFQKHKNV